MQSLFEWDFNNRERDVDEILELNLEQQAAFTGATFTALPDDQFNQRADKLGFYGSLEEARVCVDSRAVVGITLQP